MMRLWLGLAGINGAIGVGMAAYAAHGLAGLPGQEMAALAAQFQILHGLALAVVAVLSRLLGGRLVQAAGFALLAGIVLFCGSLYARALLPVPPLPTTPLGGVSLISGWLLLAAVGLFSRRT